MVTRKQVLLSAAAITGGAGAFGAYSHEEGKESYISAARGIWRRTEGLLGSSLLVQRELVRYATMAPSSHNTQCWKFHIEDQEIAIMPDYARRCSVVDPDDHHLFVSLGCAAENLIQAALANGLNGTAQFDSIEADHIRVAMEPTKPVVSPLFQAITERQCTRADYDGKALSVEELGMLERAGTGNGVQIMLLTEKSAMEKVIEYVVAGNSAQMNNPAFVKELKAWIRFGDSEAVRTGDGLFSRTTGNPSVPRWLGSLLFGMLYAEKSENEKYARQIRSSAGIAVFVSEANDKRHWVEAGRCYERFALQAAALGIRNAMINQPVEVSALRPQFATYLEIENGRPDLVVRFGRGPRMSQSLRRPVQDVMV